MFIEPRKTLKGRFYVFRGYIADFLRFEDTNEPPVAVTVVYEKESVALDDVRLSVYGSRETMEGIDEVKVDGFVGYREGGGAVVIDIVFAVIAVRVVVEDGAGLCIVLDGGSSIGMRLHVARVVGAKGVGEGSVHMEFRNNKSTKYLLAKYRQTGFEYPFHGRRRPPRRRQRHRLRQGRIRRLKLPRTWYVVPTAAVRSLNRLPQYFHP